MKMAEYMMDHIGEEFEGIITGLANFGMFVQLPNLVEGLVHITELDGYFIYDEKLQILIDKKTKKRYSLGEKVNVKCIAASKEDRSIDFELVKGGDKNGEKKEKSKENSN